MAAGRHASPRPRPNLAKYSSRDCSTNKIDRFEVGDSVR